MHPRWWFTFRTKERKTHSTQCVRACLCYHHLIPVRAWSEPHAWHRAFLANHFLFSPEGDSFVRRPTSFSWALKCPSLHSCIATPSLERWCAMLCAFFFKMLSGAEASQRTDSLSPKTRFRSLQGVPIIWSLGLNLCKHSHDWFVTVNSKPKVLDSPLFCFLDF